MSTDFNLDSRLHSDTDIVDIFPLPSAQEQNKFQKEEKEEEENESAFRNASL